MSRSPGSRTSAIHRLTAGADGTTHLIIGIQHDGPLAGVARRLFGGRTMRYLRMEADGLKAASEATDTTTGA